jgi:hypothetical protein
VVPIASLWLPILVSAVLVFFASYAVHALLGYHSADFRKAPNEDAAMEAIRGLSLSPGDYHMPRPGSAAAMRDPDFLARMKRGPNVVMTVMPPHDGGMGQQLGAWFVFLLVVGLFVAYVTTLALPAGAPYMTVFRVSSAVAFMSFAIGQWPRTIWYRKAWQTSLKETFDALLYGLLIGGAFGWLWPR